MAKESGSGPKRASGYSEDTNEAPSKVDEEAVDVEESLPADKRSSVEAVGPEGEAPPPLFEE